MPKILRNSDLKKCLEEPDVKHLEEPDVKYLEEPDVKHLEEPDVKHLEEPDVQTSNIYCRGRRDVQDLLEEDEKIFTGPKYIYTVQFN